MKKKTLTVAQQIQKIEKLKNKSILSFLDYEIANFEGSKLFSEDADYIIKAINEVKDKLL
jgi:tRNA A37 threonylcarbamoyladenosine dehydratase